MRNLGINRLSIGCQTFDNNILKLCNRKNTKSQVAQVVNAAHDVGLSVNIDMMTGLPAQSLEEATKLADDIVTRKIRRGYIVSVRQRLIN